MFQVDPFRLPEYFECNILLEEQTLPLEDKVHLFLRVCYLSGISFFYLLFYSLRLH